MLNQFKVEVADSVVKLRDSEPNAKTGEVKSYPTQVAYLHKPGVRYPQQFTLYIPADRKGKPYEPGMYEIDPSSAYSSNGKLQFSMNKLLPLPPGAAAQVK